MAGDKAHGLGDPRMLEKIDKLFLCGAGQYVHLPQIVVVGDQSSGKSSVLEGLIQLPLPRDSGLCTRFATQIVFQRSPKEEVVATVVSKTSRSQDKNQDRAWKKQYDKMTPEIFGSMMKEVHATMGLACKMNGKLEAGPIFSEDVLRLEIRGPDEDHLSVIDVPGIFRNTTGGSVTEADMSMVLDMVCEYMKNSRSAILMVIPANVDMATQEIETLAKKYDRGQRRTLGVLTKPDLVDPGAESAIIDLVEDQSRAMHLGWHLLRNPGQKQLGDNSFERDTAETTFFRENLPWSSIDKDKVGIHSLRRRLREVLSDLVRREFPRVREDISRRLSSAEAQLNALGMERQSRESQSIYLTEMTTKFQELVSMSVEANYGRHAFFSVEHSRRLATRIMERSNSYAWSMSEYGAEHSFAKIADASDEDSEHSVESDNGSQCGSEHLAEVDGKDEAASLDGSHSVEKYEEDNDGKDENVADVTNRSSEVSVVNPFEVDIRQQQDANGLEGLLQPQEKVEVEKSGYVLEWLRSEYISTRGLNLGVINSSILASAMEAQSGKWDKITLGYISDVISMIHQFILDGLKHVCTDERVEETILATLVDEGLLSRYTKAMDQARFLLSVERSGTPMTLNSHFSNNVEKFRSRRPGTKTQSFPFDSLNDGTRHTSNTTRIVEDVHDILHSYYRIARKRMVDNVFLQAVMYLLVKGPETPLCLFSPLFVSKLTADQLEAIAGEEPGTRVRRKQLREEIRVLKEARKILV